MQAFRRRPARDRKVALQCACGESARTRFIRLREHHTLADRSMRQIATECEIRVSH
jgi:hypothetical protein